MRVLRVPIWLAQMVLRVTKAGVPCIRGAGAGKGSTQCPTAMSALVLHAALGWPLR